MGEVPRRQLHFHRDVVMAAGKRGLIVAGAVSVVVGGSVGALAAWLADVSWLLAALLALLCLFVSYAVSAYGLWDKADRARKDTLAEIEHRLGTLRYAFTFGGAGARVRKHADGDTWDIEVWVTFTSSSAEPIRYTVEELTVIIDGQRSEEDDSVYRHSAVVPPHRDANALCPLVRNVSMPWQYASVEFTIRYGHAEGELRHRQSQTYMLMIQKILGRPNEVIELSALLVKNPEVEDVDSDYPSRGTGRTG
jgi:hypothetical protein